MHIYIVLCSVGVPVLYLDRSSGFNDVVMRSWSGYEALPINSIVMTSMNYRLVV